MTPEKNETRGFRSCPMNAELFALSSEALPAKRQSLIAEPVELLIEHPFDNRKGVLAGSCYVRAMARRWRFTRASSGSSNKT